MLLCNHGFEFPDCAKCRDERASYGSESDASDSHALCKRMRGCIERYAKAAGNYSLAKGFDEVDWLPVEAEYKAARHVIDTIFGEPQP